MVNYRLMISADFENVSNIQPMSGFVYFFKLRCLNCGEITEMETAATLGISTYVPGGCGDVNLIQKCKGCDRVGGISLIPGAGHPLTASDSALGKYALLMGFKGLNGLEPVSYHPGGAHWRVRSTNGTVFEYVDLARGKWADYDNKGKLVSVSNLKSHFEVVKKVRR